MMAGGPGPPVQSLFLMKDELESDHRQPPRSPLVCPPLPVLGENATTVGEGENLHRDVDGIVDEPQAAFEQVSQEQEESRFLDSPLHGFNLPYEREAGCDRLQLPVQPKTNDGKGELVLHSQGWRVETTDGGNAMWLLIGKQDGTVERRRIFV